MAEDRKARLAALAARAGRTTKYQTDGASASAAAAAPAVEFRNYAPKTSPIGEGGAGNPDLSSSAPAPDIPAAKRPRTGEVKTGDVPPKSALEEALLQAKAEASTLTGGNQGSGISPGAVAGGSSLAAMAPKKVNWDLKRDIQGKLDRLERRTQRSLVELLRERLEKEAEDGGDGYAALD